MAVKTAYTSWLFGGFIGMHHLYLERPRQAFLYAITFGYCGIAWVLDLLYLWSWVRRLDSIDKPGSPITETKHKTHGLGAAGRVSVACSELAVGLLLGGLATCLPSRQLYDELPRDQYYILRNACFATGAVLGVWLAGNREGARTSALPLLVAAAAGAAVSPTVYGILFIVWLVAQRVFTSYDSIEADKSKYPVVHFYSKLTLFTGLLAVATYHHGTYATDIKDEFGEPTGLEEQHYLGDDVNRFFNGEAISQLHEAWTTVWTEVRNRGAWNLMKDSWKAISADAEGDAFKVLGLDKGASMKEIRKAFRSRSLEFHPDKWVSASPEQQKIAEDNFILNKNAYDVLRGNL